MPVLTTLPRRPALAVALMLTFAVAGCAGYSQSTGLPSLAPTTPPASATPGTPASTPAPAGLSVPAAPSESAGPSGSPSAGASDTASPEPSESIGSTAHGDIPDNAVFLTDIDTAHGFSIDYVEGWQVTPGPDGVVIRDKDSSETVQIVPSVSDIAAYVSSADLPALQATPGFRLEKQDTVTIKGQHFVHLLYHVPAAPDPVTGKQVPSLVDRYYVPGPSGLGLVTLSTPEGVDNIDQFKVMIESFRWR